MTDDISILTESELDALDHSSGDDVDMASVHCVVRELRALRAERDKLAGVRDAIVWVANRIDPPGDWACAECKPYSDMLHINPGFRCAIHVLRAYVAP